MHAQRLDEPILPALFVSRLDSERIEALLDSPAFQHLDTSALRAELDRAEIVEPAQMPPDVITMNSTVRLALHDGSEREVTLVYPNGVDGRSDRVSILAPVGSALLGLRVGQAIRWPAPGGSVDLRVLAIGYQPEAAGDLHR
ncbi:nucleoside diphosphate kinase regulator [Lysobacter solisilvae (ex Woo and Kim 2020)]|uniref:Nucleoside diphosphate kinase regulator n=1 Tax=Agrilutibacter terrestris TaxID=2865112 RepID=A0A7H0FW58_9GAMM|nr:nucleoside diphosphate kinase regulator [Lysobacter terrestris]QNP40274.1 nucleoside diphosphate kinase regulator [Lysobacter terrestris]